MVNARDVDARRSTKRTMLGLVGIELSKNITIDRSQATDDEVLAGFDN